MTTVGELITKLQALDPQLPVLIDGYEGGYMEPLFFQREVVHVGPRAYMGEFETVESARWEIEDGGEPFEAVLLVRYEPT